MSPIVIGIYSFCVALKRFRMGILAALINKVFVRILFSCQIGLGARIGKGCVLGYGGLGVVIHKGCNIGNNVNIGPNCTLGGNYNASGVPVVGDNTIISTGAKIIGNIRIGANCIIGANAVVLCDIPDNCVAVGVPARIIKTNINMDDYR